jgi:DNA repair protein RecO (recombination protein O)
MKLFDCRGIIINKRDFGEADRYITIFSENFGKISVLLKGIRKSKTREQSSADVLTLSKFTFYKKGENFILTNILTLDAYREIKENLDNLEISLYLLSILNSILVENNRKKNLFTITEKTLNFLKDNNDMRKNYILIIFYLYTLIKEEGLKFSLGEGAYFSFEGNGFFQEERKYSYRVSKIGKEMIEKVVNKRIKDIINGEYPLKEIKNVTLLFERYLNFHLGTEFNLKNYLMGVE